MNVFTELFGTPLSLEGDPLQDTEAPGKPPAQSTRQRSELVHIFTRRVVLLAHGSMTLW